MKKIIKDPRQVIGCLFNYKDLNGSDVNFYYMFNKRCFTLIDNDIPVSFRFNDYNNNVEVYVDKENKEKVDYSSLFNNLRIIIGKYPLLHFVINCTYLDDSKLKFIEDNCDSMSFIIDKDMNILLDVKLEDLGLKSIYSKKETDEIVSEDLKVYRKRYNDIMIKLNENLFDLGLELNIGVKVSKEQGLKLVINDSSDNCRLTSVINLLLDGNNNCLISNFEIEKVDKDIVLNVLKCFDKLGELEFIDTIVYSASIGNSVYKLLPRLGYVTKTGYLVPKSPMVKGFK